MNKRASRKKNTLVLELHDGCMRYIVTEFSNTMQTISSFGDIALQEEVIKDNEIIQLELISKIIKKIHRQYKVKNLVLVLPVRAMRYMTITLPISSSQKELRKHVQKHNATETHSSLKNGVCHLVSRTPKDDTHEYVTFACIKNDTYLSYESLAKKTGLKLTAVTSPEEFLMNQDHTSVVVFGKKDTYLLTQKQEVLEYKQFALSYNSLVKVIMSELDVKHDEAEKILKEHGFMSSHKEEKVYKKILAQLQPLLAYLKIHKKHYTSLKLVELYASVPGLEDSIGTYIGKEVHRKEPHFEDYPHIGNLISIPQSDIYKYQFLLESLYTNIIDR